MKTYNLRRDQLPFDLDLTLDCGQVFRWQRIKNTWNGVVAGRVVTISQDGPIKTEAQGGPVRNRPLLSLFHSNQFFQQNDGGFFIQGLVVIAAFGRLNAARTALQTGTFGNG